MKQDLPYSFHLLKKILFVELARCICYNQDSDLRSALLLEQAAHCFLRLKQPMPRKYTFHMILAGHRFSKAGQVGLNWPCVFSCLLYAFYSENLACKGGGDKMSQNQKRFILCQWLIEWHKLHCIFEYQLSYWVKRRNIIYIVIFVIILCSPLLLDIFGYSKSKLFFLLTEETRAAHIRSGTSDLQKQGLVPRRGQTFTLYFVFEFANDNKKFNVMYWWLIKQNVLWNR